LRNIIQALITDLQVRCKNCIFIIGNLTKNLYMEKIVDFSLGLLTLNNLNNLLLTY